MGKLEDLTGQRFGRLTVIEHSHSVNYRHYWLCKCDCGKIKTIRGSHLKSGAIRSCGCLSIEELQSRATHHKTKSRLYIIWNSMKKRCYQKNDIEYKYYGGRGITICDKWKDNFQAFYEWSIANGYDENAKRGECTIDRIDVKGNYAPDNCRWVDKIIQANNKTNNQLITYNGETHTIAEWSRIKNISYATIYARFKIYNYSIEDVFNKPIKYKNKLESEV